MVCYLVVGLILDRSKDPLSIIVRFLLSNSGHFSEDGAKSKEANEW